MGFLQPRSRTGAWTRPGLAAVAADLMRSSLCAFAFVTSEEGVGTSLLLFPHYSRRRAAGRVVFVSASLNLGLLQRAVRSSRWDRSPARCGLACAFSVARRRLVGEELITRSGSSPNINVYNRPSQR